MQRSYGGALTQFPGIAVLCRIIPGCSLFRCFVPEFVVKGTMRIFKAKLHAPKGATFRFEQISAGLSRTLKKLADFGPGMTRNDQERP
jgi:hypothetical protein